MQVRKAAQEAVTLLLKKPPGDMQHHPASASTAKFCIQQIEEHGGKGSSWVVPFTSDKGFNMILHDYKNQITS